MTITMSRSTTPTAATCAGAPRTLRATHRTAVAPRRRSRALAPVAPIDSPVARPAVARQTRLTRRGRVVLLLALVGLLLGAFSLGRGDAPQAATAPEPAAAVVPTTVQPGESLWTVAKRVAPKSDPREVVQELRHLNHLTTSNLQVGQQLLLPV